MCSYIMRVSIMPPYSYACLTSHCRRRVCIEHIRTRDLQKQLERVLGWAPGPILRTHLFNGVPTQQMRGVGSTCARELFPRARSQDSRVRNHERSGGSPCAGARRTRAQHRRRSDAVGARGRLGKWSFRNRRPFVLYALDKHVGDDDGCAEVLFLTGHLA